MNENPYEAPRDSNSEPLSQFVWKFCRLAGWVLIVVCVATLKWTRTPYNDFRNFGRILDFILTLGITCSPVVYLEIVGRFVPKSRNTFSAAFSLVLCGAIVVGTFGLQGMLIPVYSSVLSFLSIGDAWWPTVYEGNAIGFVVTSVVILVVYQFAINSDIKKKLKDE